MRTHLGTRLALLVYALGAFAYRDAIMDDTFIHMVYARNLRQLGELSFNAGEPSLGFTSPLWVLLLAVLGPSLAAAKLASLACGGLSVYVFGRVAHRLLGSAAIAVGATFAWAGSLWLVRHAPNGMETALAVLLVLAAVELGMRPGRGAAVTFGVALALAILTRPECVLLLPGYLLRALSSKARRRQAMIWLPVCILLAGGWFVLAHAGTGSAMPDTATAKSGGLHWAPLVWARVLWRQARLLAAAQAAEILVMAMAAFLILLHDRRAPARWLRHDLAPYAGMTILLAITFALNQVQVQPRYLVPVLPVIVLVGFASWRALLGGSRRVAWLGCTASLAVSLASSWLLVFPATHAFSQALLPALRPLAATVASDGRDGVCVATPDIGIVGWEARARVLDLGGLIDPRAQEWVRQYGYDTMLRDGIFLAAGRVDYVIDRSRERERFRNHTSAGVRWEVLHTTVIPNLGLSRPGPFFYTLYALRPAAN